MATQTFQVLYTSLFEMNYNLCKKQVNETVWKKLINLILIKKYLRPYFDRQPCRNIIIYNNGILIKKQMNVEIMQWDLRLLVTTRLMLRFCSFGNFLAFCFSALYLDNN
jgi:hypothetical protein